MITCCNVFNVWPKTTLLLPMWPRAADRLGTPETDKQEKWLASDGSRFVHRYYKKAYAFTLSNNFLKNLM